MNPKFSLHDDRHDELRSYSTLDAALTELNRLVRTPWNEGLNRAPCVGWEECGRSWELSEWAGDTESPMRVIATLNVSRSGRYLSVGPDAAPTEASEIGQGAPRGRARRSPSRPASKFAARNDTQPQPAGRRAQS
jgi:hypothetical protein